MAGDGYAEREVVSLSSPAPVLCFLLFSQPSQMSYVKISGNSNCAKEGLQYVKYRSTCAHGLSELNISSLGLDLYSSGGEIAGCFVQSNGAKRVNTSGNESLNAGPHTMICYQPPNRGVSNYRYGQTHYADME
jgi:hypothetical protein